MTSFSLQDLFELKVLVNNITAKLTARIESGLKQLLAIITNDGDILLYYNYGELKPVLKRIPWYTDSNKEIEALCFDPTATWLLVISIDGSLHIIPALSLVDKRQKVDCKWSLSDATYFPKHPQSPDGRPTSIIWWQTSDSNQNALVGFDNSKIALISLTDGRCINCCGINEPIKDMILCQDASIDCVSLLINAESGYQWRLILEHHTTGYVWSSETTQAEESSHSKLQNLKQMGVDKLTSLKQRLSEARGGTRRDSSSDSTSDSVSVEFNTKAVPERLPHLSDTYFAPQFARNRYLFSVFYKKHSLMTVHSTVDSAPLCVYKLPDGTSNILLTDRLIFATNDVEKLVTVISSQLSECEIEDQSDFCHKALIAQFQLKDDEEIISIYRVADKLPTKEKIIFNTQNKDSYIIPKSYHDLSGEKFKLDTCVIITNAAVYKIRVKYSLVNLFIKLIIDDWNLQLAECISIVFGLNYHKLLEVSGDFLISNGSYHAGLVMYKEAKAHILKRVLKFAMVSDCKNLLRFVNLCLNASKMDMSIATKIHIGNLAVMAYTELILRFHGEKRIENTNEFMQFLCHEEYYDQVLAVNVACQAGLWNVVTLLAKTRGLQLEVVVTISQILQTSRIPRVNDYNFLIVLSEPSLTQSLVVHTTACQTILSHVRNYYKEFPIDILRRFLLQLDPSQPTLLPLTNCLFKRKLNSSSLDTTVDSLEFDNSELCIVMKDVIETFILLLLELVHRAEENSYNISLLDKIQMPDMPVNNEKRLAHFPDFKPLSCGFEHAAIIRNRCIYTMGISNSGRLGLGPLLTPNSSPALVQMLKDMKLRVYSVSCGRKHTLALTDFGVYSWGSNAYGQLGLGPTVLESPYPQVIATLSGVEIVDIVAGQYHSVALTSTGRVYTWGWGIHGQLGHGNYDNQYYPKLLEECPALQIAAGHAHTILVFEDFVAGCGSNAFMQLTDLYEKKINKLTRVHVVVNENMKPIKRVTSAYFHNIAVFANNEVCLWGANPHEMRSSNSKKMKHTSVNIPIRIYSPDNEKPIEQISVGFSNCALIHNGKVYWGKSKEGKLYSSNIQEEDKCGLFDQKFTHVSCGLDFILALEQSGKLMAWGNSKTSQIIMGKTIESDKADERILIFKNTRRLLKIPHNPDAYLDSNFVEIPGLPSMDIIYDTYTHSSLFLKNTISNAVKLIENDLQPNEFKSNKNIHKKSRTFDYIKECPTYKYGQRTLHYVLETYFGYYDTESILSKCIDYNNYQAVSKIAMLDGHFGDSLSFQLKAFKNYLDKFPIEYSTRIITKPSIDVKNNDINKHIELHSIKLNEINNEINSPVQMLSTSSSLDSIRHWGDDLEHQGGCESPCEISDIGDVRHSMTQYLLSIKESQSIQTVSKLISTESNTGVMNKTQEIECHIADVKTKELINTASQLIEFYIKKTYTFENHILMQNILMKCIDFWLTNNLPVFALEKILLKNMDKYFYPLSILLFCKNFNNSLNDDFEKNDEYKSVGFLKEFSTKFCLQLCSMVLENVTKQ